MIFKLSNLSSGSIYPKLTPSKKALTLLTLFLFLMLGIPYLFIFHDAISTSWVPSLTLFFIISLILAVVTTYIIFSHRSIQSAQKIMGNLVNQLPNNLILTDRQGTVLTISEDLKNTFERPLTNIRDLCAFMPDPEQISTFLALVANKAGTPLPIYVYGKGQAARHYEISVFNLQDQCLWLFTQLVEEDLSALPRDTAFQKSLNSRYLFNRAPAGNVIIDQAGLIQGFNQTLVQAFDLAEDVAIGLPFTGLLSKNSQDEFQTSLSMMESTAKSKIPLELELKNGKLVQAYYNTLAFEDLQDKTPYLGFYLQLFDHSENKQIQQRAIQSQKLQALGQLAGGIAHDFNNLLTAMVGYCDLLLLRHSPGDQSFSDIMQVKQNANRATNLVRQLLAFSRQQTLQPKVLDISDILSELSLLLQRLIGSKIELRIIHGRNLWAVKADRGQLEQVFINLIVNARDAIRDKGNIKIITNNITLKDPMTHGHEIVPAGNYIQIEVIDDGCGIERDKQHQIFDPFFSTKDIGAGTGLGLSTVYGIIKQTEGFIVVDSTPKVGTKFTIFLPCAAADATVTPMPSESNGDKLVRDLTGTGNILLAEDEDAVRIFAARALTDKGYTVIEAANGLEALAYLKAVKNAEDVPQLLVTDVIMPKMDGPTLVKEALKLYPDMRVMYISGYAEDAFRSMVSEDKDIQFLAKPFSLKVLATKVKEVFKALPVNTDKAENLELAS